MNNLGNQVNFNEWLTSSSRIMRELAKFIHDLKIPFDRIKTKVFQKRVQDKLQPYMIEVNIYFGKPTTFCCTDNDLKGYTVIFNKKQVKWMSKEDLKLMIQERITKRDQQQKEKHES